MYPIKITKLASKGLGVIATQALKPSQLILHEHPLVRVDKSPGSPDARSNQKCIQYMNRVMEMAKTGQFNPRSDFNTLPKEVVSCYEGVLNEQSIMAYDKLEKHKQNKWMELADVFAKDNDDKTPGGILRTNAIDDDSNHANLYEQLSRINHSCQPNTIRASTDKIGGVAIVANKDIAKDEEITINYMDGVDDGKPVEKRREHLMQQYHFHCTCDLCMEQETESST